MPLIVVRSDDGNIRSFINACSHRAALVVRELSGNARNWTCLFHHWCFDTRGNCIHIPRDEAYDKVGLCKEKLGLRVVRTQTRLGMVFVNLDDGAPPLDDYLGDALENLVPVMGDPERSLEVFHYSKTIVRANWKQWLETNMDPYHEYLHYVNRRVAMKGDGYHDRVWKIYSGAHATLSPMRQRYEAVKGYQCAGSCDGHEDRHVESDQPERDAGRMAGLGGERRECRGPRHAHSASQPVLGPIWAEPV